MTESHRFTMQSGMEFALDALREIARARLDGAATSEEIATALNRGGFSDQRGRQWDSESVMRFLASRDAQLAQRRLDKGEA